MGGFSILTAVRTQRDVFLHDYDSQMFINISEYRAAAMYSDTDVQVFPKQLKQMTKLLYVKTHKQLFIEPNPYVSIHT